MATRVTESYIRQVIRQELREMMADMGGEPSDPMKDPKTMAMGALGAGAAMTPYAIAQYLQTDPEMMQKVIDMIQSAGDFMQSFEE